jgi:hypothetical protein
MIETLARSKATTLRRWREALPDASRRPAIRFPAGPARHPRG